MTNDSVHNLLIIIGLIVPITIVSFVLGSSLTGEENIYLTNYDANGRLLLHASSFEDMNTICWLRPDYIIKLVNLSHTPSALSMDFQVNLPVGFILFSQRSLQLTDLQSSGEFRLCLNSMHVQRIVRPPRKVPEGERLMLAARNCVILYCTLGLGFLVGPCGFESTKLIEKYNSFLIDWIRALFRQ